MKAAAVFPHKKERGGEQDTAKFGTHFLSFSFLAGCILVADVARVPANLFCNFRASRSGDRQTIHIGWNAQGLLS